MGAFLCEEICIILIVSFCIILDYGYWIIIDVVIERYYVGSIENGIYNFCCNVIL